MLRVYDQFDIVTDWFDEQAILLSETKKEEYKVEFE